MQISSKMKAWMCRTYGGPEVLTLETVKTPLPKPHEVLIRTRATTVSSGDARVRAMRLPPGFGPLGRLMFGFRGPRQPILGSEVSGVVADVGNEVTRFQPGESVIAFPDTGLGGHAEYLAIAETGLIVRKPCRLSYETAASLSFGGLTARDYIRKSELKSGERLLVIGASGAVGGAFVQLARGMGVHVTTVTSIGNVGLARDLGAAVVIDYETEDFTEARQGWDVIADTVASSSFRLCQPVLNEGGRYLAIAGGLADMLPRKNGTRRSVSGPARSRLEDLNELVRLAETGEYQPVIDEIFPFEKMREAHARTDTGRKRGSVVVLVDDA